MKMTPIYTLMLAAGLAACSKDADENTAKPYTIGEKTFSMVDENKVGVADNEDPMSGFFNSYAGRRSIYSLPDSAITTRYNGYDYAIGGNTRFWRKDEFTIDEKAEFQQAVEYAESTRPLQNQKHGF